MRGISWHVRSAAQAASLTALLAAGCGASVDTTSRSADDLATPTPSVAPASAVPHGNRLDLHRIVPSVGGDALVAWGEADDGGRIACDVRLSQQIVHCAMEPKETDFFDVSSTGNLVAMTAGDGLVVRGLASRKPVVSAPVDARIVGAVFSPDERFVGFLDARGDLRVARIEDGVIVAHKRGDASPHPTETRTAKLRWATNGLLLAASGGSAALVTLKETPSPLGTLTRVTPLAVPASACADADVVEGELLVVGCNGYVGAFDMERGVESRLLVPDGRLRDMSGVSLEVRGGRALLLWHRGFDRTRLEVVEPAAARALVHARNARFVTADLTPAGHLGWMEEIFLPGLGGLEWRSYTQDLTAPGAPAAFEGLFHQWSGDAAIATREGVTLVVDGRPAFAHDAQYAPWAEVVRRGRFSWVSGGSAMLRLTEGDSTPYAFDVFGSVAAPRLARTALNPVSPAISRAPRDRNQGEKEVDAEVGGPAQGIEQLLPVKKH